MNTVAKILIVINLILAGAFLASASNFLGQEDHWKKKHEADTKELQTKIDDVQAALDKQVTANAQLMTQSQALQKDIGTAQERVTQLETQNDMLNESFKEASKQLTQSTDALKAAQGTIQANGDMINQLNQERTTLIEAKRVAMDKADAAVRNLQEKEIQFENLMAQKQGLEARVEELAGQLRSAQLTAETATARAGGAGATDVPMDQPAHTGQVLSVDALANVAIISLGSEDGVRPGFRYTVSRGSQFVGMLEITDVQAKQSAGRSIKSLEKSTIQRGDRAMSR